MERTRWWGMKGSGNGLEKRAARGKGTVKVRAEENGSA